MQQLEVTVGIGGAAGDGSGATGDNLAKVCSRLGLHVFAYNSYQSLVRGGHVWLRLRIAAQKVMTHGDDLNLLIGLNQDTLDRHAREVVPGGGILYNERLKVVQDDLQARGAALSLADQGPLAALWPSDHPAEYRSLWGASSGC